jgi:hypothetical protein
MDESEQLPWTAIVRSRHLAGAIKRILDSEGTQLVSVAHIPYMRSATTLVGPRCYMVTYLSSNELEFE